MFDRYKLLRADAVNDLVADFYSYAGVHPSSGFVARALDNNDVGLLQLLDNVEVLPLQLVSGTVATDHRGTILHHLAGSSTIPFGNSLLEKTAISHSQLKQVWDINGVSAFTIAEQVANEAAQQVLNPGQTLLVLEKLFRSTRGPTNWGHADNWGTVAPLSEWKGIKIDKAKRVVDLMLGEMGLEGMSERLYFCWRAPMRG